MIFLYCLEIFPDLHFEDSPCTLISYLSPNIDNNLEAFSSNGPEWIIIMKMVATHCLQLERGILNVSIKRY